MNSHPDKSFPTESSFFPPVKVLSEVHSAGMKTSLFTANQFIDFSGAVDVAFKENEALNFSSECVDFFKTASICQQHKLDINLGIDGEQKRWGKVTH